MDKRINLGKKAPHMYDKLISLKHDMQALIKDANMNEGFSHLLLLRASQINGCAFCVRLHTKDALDTGENIERISVLPAWRETEYFNEKERASLELVEAICYIKDTHFPNKVYEEAKEVLDEKEILAVEWLALIINALNILAISSRLEVK
ncbi:carboxymuconolactone decarboxylase family protein [Candidatus Marinarcus aquaticus]|uniref:Alkylhydroperoxidase n=1 Tax=Candidatus Marinarcus aquaticus TaxID=2044504 RepID=A0A4Q0XM45_9BACT|nr:carboxymuconolactone decarboxylase family protein [Candidatus Marinarcus aquaticus]RXJ54147.1 alkylhydroperoxidase [Candidatus Marinarcus aquaticus]